MYEFVYGIGSISIIALLSESIWLSYCALHTSYLAKKAKVFTCDSKGVEPSTLVVGDSFILGVGVSDPVNSLGGRLSTHYGKESTVVRAISGARLREIHELLAPVTPAATWDRVIIFCGGMDIVHTASEKQLRKDLQALFAQAKKYSKHIIYISPGNTGIVPVFHFPLSLMYTAVARKFHRIAEEVAAHEGVEFISTFSEASTSLFKNKHHLYVSDFNHVNDEGCGILFESIKDRLT